MQALESLELTELRNAWGLFLNRTVDSFEWGDCKNAKNESVIEAAKECLNDAVFYTLLEEVTMGRDAYFVTDKVSTVIGDLADDSAFVSDCLGEDSDGSEASELFEEYVHHVNQAVSMLRSDHWSKIVKDAQASIETAAHMTGAYGWVSSVGISASDCTVYLLGRDDLQLERRFIIKTPTTISDFVNELESAGVVEVTFGRERYIYVVDNKFAPSDDVELSKGDVLIIYRVKRDHNV